MLEAERWQALKDHFNRALDLPAADRAVFVATSFPEDPTMRQELDRLVRAEAAHGAFLEGMALDGVDSAPELDPLALRSKRVGQYELLERVAVGGMGENVCLGDGERLRNSGGLTTTHLIEGLSGSPC
jgi:hypothetical protein